MTRKIRTDGHHDQPHWRLLHKHYLDSLAQQSPKLRDALGQEIGESFDAFLQAMNDGLLQTSAEVRSNGALWYTLYVRVSDGLGVLAIIEASNLGLDCKEIKRNEANLRKMRKQRTEGPPEQN
jgi:hypothetical protein